MSLIWFLPQYFTYRCTTERNCLKLLWSVVFFLTVDKDGRGPCITDRNCHKQATCNDFKCYCKKGYKGNGHMCIGKIWTFFSSRSTFQSLEYVGSARCCVIGRHRICILYPAFLTFSTCNVNCAAEVTPKVACITTEMGEGGMLKSYSVVKPS